MSRLTIVVSALFLAGLFLAASSAQEKAVDVPKASEPKKEEPKKVGGPSKGNMVESIPGDCEIHFLNGSKVRMIIQSDKLDIATAYGKLSVPVKDVRAIEFGLHFPEGMEAKIEAAIKGGACRARAVVVSRGPRREPRQGTGSLQASERHRHQAAGQTHQEGPEDFRGR
jgi:hypothetical protein